MKKILLLLLITVTVFAFADDASDDLTGFDDFFSEDSDGGDFNFDDMFGDESEDALIEEVEDQSDEVAELSEEFLTTEGVEWGGSFSASITSGVTYEEFPEIDEITDDSVESTFDADLSADLYFNARPTDDTRFYGKFSTSVPFYSEASVALEDEDTDTADDYYFADVSIPDITIEELFSDFDWDSKIFFRVGKQNAKWGVGYFFSPADFLSLESIDPDDPTADREGPVAIKMSIPFGDLNNFYTFITVPEDVFSDEDADITDLIVAPMAQFVLGDIELSTGVYYRNDHATRGMLTATYGTNSNVGKFSYFGEAVAQYGSDKIFIEDDFTTTTYEDEFFFNGTAGVTWSKEILDNTFSLTGQYYYNGEGYDTDSDSVATILEYYSTEDTSLFTTDQLSNLSSLSSSGLSYSDLTYRNKHYLGASFSISSLFANDDLSLSSYGIFNLADGSGYIIPSLSYTFFDGLSTTLQVSFNLSDEGDEYDGDNFAISLGFNLGSGDF